MYHIMISVNFSIGGCSLYIYKSLKIHREIGTEDYTKVRNILFLKGIEIKFNCPIEISEQTFNLIEKLCIK